MWVMWLIIMKVKFIIKLKKNKTKCKVILNFTTRLLDGLNVTLTILQGFYSFKYLNINEILIKT
jgi:hypothetical protein